MPVRTISVFRLSFKLLCVVVAFAVIIYWVHKSVFEDEDLCLVDYKPFEKSKDVVFPILSMCFLNPFIDSKLKEINPSITVTSYYQYLKGEKFDEMFYGIDYKNVTLSLSDYYLFTRISWKNGSVKFYYDLSTTEVVKPLNVTFNGFAFGMFYKCFGTEVNEKYQKDIKYMSQMFKQNEYIDRASGHYFMIVSHYPKQLLQIGHNYKTFLSDRQHYNKSYALRFKVTYMEILKQRNKRKDPCTTRWKEFDDLVLNKHSDTIGCYAPYQMTPNHHQLPICSTKTKLKESMYELNIVKNKYYPPPCQSMPNIVVDMDELDLRTLYLNNTILELTIGFPEGVKLITQHKAIDINSLIGFIGGYIGLLLGWTIVQLPDLILDIVEKAKKKREAKKDNTRPENETRTHETFVMEKSTTEMQTISSANNIVLHDRKKNSMMTNRTTSTTSLAEEVCGTLMQKFNGILNRMDSVELSVNSFQDRVDERLEKINIELHHGEGVSNSAILVSKGTSTNHPVATTESQLSSNGNYEPNWV